uniref:Uncharacterized protein n=1 Tax=Oryza sativa subsp. japonica TaxID=39947 RepID=Q10Q94_ORYSJ|nr:hypothetical protein LOC_Os03g10730 [Oryza sativa Japonica Group]
MAVLVKLMSSLFGSPRSESIIKKLNLRFCLLTDLETSLDYLFNIGELVCNAIDSGKDIALDFQGEVIWITPEGKKLRSALNKITKLFLHGIYVKFDLLWTLVLLESAPSVKVFGVKVWNHACDEGTENRKQLYERNDLWDAAQLDGSIHYLQLERLEFGGFNQIIREHLDFIRAIIERAPNLKSVILEDRSL